MPGATAASSGSAEVAIEAVRVLGRQGDHFGCPRISDMTGDHLEIWKLQRDVIDVQDWPTRFGRTKRARVPYLKTEWNAQLDTLCV